MKTLQISIIIFSFLLTSILSSSAFGSQPCTAGGYIHYGPSRQSVPCYLVYSQLNLNHTLEELYGNPVTQIDYHGTKLIVINMVNKTTFKVGENVTVIPELTNIGNQNVTIGYMPPLFDTEVTDQHGKKIWPPYIMGVKITVGFGMTLKPNTSSPDHTFQGQIGKNVFALDSPGNYTIISVASFSHDAAGSNLALWSKPLQITVLPENSPTTSNTKESPQSSANQSCDRRLSEQRDTILNSIDKRKAIFLATNDTDFRGLVGDSKYIASEPRIGSEGTDYNNCRLVNPNIQIQFNVLGQNSNLGNCPYVLVIESQTASKVLAVDLGSCSSFEAPPNPPSTLSAVLVVGGIASAAAGGISVFIMMRPRK